MLKFHSDGLRIPSFLEASRKLLFASALIAVPLFHFGAGNAAAAVDMQVFEAANPGPVTVGQVTTYTITVHNNGPANLGGDTIVTDNLPLNSIFAGAITPVGSCTHFGGVVTCSIGRLNKGVANDVIIHIGLIPVVNGTISNPVNITSSNPPDTNLTNNNASVNTTVVAPLNPTSTNLSLDCGTTPSTGVVGFPQTFFFHVTNNGATTATVVTLADRIAGAVPTVTASPTQGSCFSFQGILVCNFGTLAPGADASTSYQVTPTQAGTLCTSSIVGMNQTDSSLGDNVCFSCAPIIGTGVDMSVTKTATPNPVVVGNQLTYVVSVHNGGPNNATGVALTDTLPGGTSFVSAVPSQGAPCTQTLGVVTCNLGTVNNGANASATIKVVPNSHGSITNNAHVSSVQTDNFPSNNNASTTSLAIVDCNHNGVDDSIDISSHTSQDCNNDGVPDECELAGHDCNNNGILDSCDIANNTSQDCNNNGIPDSCDITSGTSADCNNNGIPDSCDIANTSSTDCNADNIPDECELAGNDCNNNGILDSCDIANHTSADCNNNGIPDSCDIANHTSTDCNNDGVPDSCEIAGNDCNNNGILDSCDVANHTSADCNNNGVPDSCDIANHTSSDCNNDGVPDSCEIAGHDCDNNGQLDVCDIATTPSLDCDNNGQLDVCDLATTPSLDCNNNGVLDSCDITSGTSTDCNNNGIPDDCELAGNDCNNNGILDSCDITSGTSADCNNNGIPDECDISNATSVDCNNDGVPDSCELAGNDCNNNGVLDSCDIANSTSADCNNNGIPDSCDIANATSTDCNNDGVPDSCELAGNDCNNNGVLDSCDIANSTSADCNNNGIPDSCDIANATSTDCNNNGVPDSCELAGHDCNNNGILDSCDIANHTSADCNSNAVPDECDIANHTSTDCNNNGVPDSCEIAGHDCDNNGQLDVCDIASTPSLDCDNNGQLDVCDLATTPSLDCNNNGVLDSCDITSGTSADCNNNGIPDSCDITSATSSDCNNDGVPDECEIAGNDCNNNGILDSCDITSGTSADCNNNGIPDECDISNATSVDCNNDGVPDSCELAGNDCNNNGILDSCDIANETSADCNNNGIPDSCDIANATSTDCNNDGVPDSCELAGHDCNNNGVLDSCELAGHDCNNNGVLDSCDIANHTATDCNNNGLPDSCELAGQDCNNNGVIDSCELAGHDCNNNGVLDSCDIANHTATDCNNNGTPDSCEITGHDCNNDGILDSCELAGHDCNNNGVLDSCDIANHTSADCNNNGVPDSCDIAAGGSTTSTWTFTSAPRHERFRAQSATLLDGRILITGGEPDGATQASTSTCEIFDPSTMMFSDTSSMATSRYEHCIATLPDGEVLVAGGVPSDACTAFTSCEKYNPGTGLWSAAASLPMPLSNSGMVLLPNGKILLCGGGINYCSDITNQSFLFDPSANGGVGSWTSTGSMSHTRMGHRVVLLDNGQVLAIGGRITISTTTGTVVTEIYNPATGTWSDTTGSLLVARGTYSDCQFAATKLANGRVLISGGNPGATAGFTLNETEIYNPSTGLWVSVAPMPDRREFHDTILLPSGKVLLAGGYNENFQPILTSYLYDPVANSWGNSATMNQSRFLFRLSLLPDGKVLAPFGSVAVQYTGLRTAEIFSPQTGTSILDCNNNGVLDSCELNGNDCNNDGILDSCELAGNDCNNNGVIDSCDIASQTSQDVNNDGTPDECEPHADLTITKSASPDPATVGQPVTYTIVTTNNGPSPAVNVSVTDTLPPNVTFGSATAGCVDNSGIVTCALGDMNAGTSISVQIIVTPTTPVTLQNQAVTTSTFPFDPVVANNVSTVVVTLVITDCNNNGIDDATDIANQTSADCNNNGIPDECDIVTTPSLDCDVNGVIDSCQLAQNPGLDCNNNGQLDSCDIATTPSLDCNNDGAIDSCELAQGQVQRGGESLPIVTDCNNNGVIDSCELAGNDCNNNGILDSCDIAADPAIDCDNNGVIDSCEIAGHDCNNNGELDRCEIATTPSLDCNLNGELDECEIATSPSLDCNHDGLLDSCEPSCVSFCDETFTTGSFDPSIWLPLGDQTDDFAITTYDPDAGAYLATITANPNFRSTGIFDNSSNCIPYDAVGTDHYVKGKFYVYRGGQTTAAQNEIPMLRIRVANRFGVNSMLEVQSHVDIDPAATAIAADIVPSTSPTSPSLYRVDFDPVNVPALNNPGDLGKLLRGFEAFSVSPQDNGYLALTEITICVYPASSLPPDQAPDQVLTTGTLDAGSLAVRNPATDVILQSYTATGLADSSVTTPTYSEGPEGVTLDTTAVPAAYLAIATREFNPGPETPLQDHLRAEPCKIYKVRFHITSTQQSNLNAHLQVRARTIRFNWTQKFEMGGAFAAGDLTNEIAQEALPGVGCLNPDKNDSENGGWYTLLMNTPLSEDIRPEFPAGTPLLVRMPHLAAEPGPGVPLTSLRDIRLGMDIVDTFDHDFRAPLEQGNMTIDRIEVRSYPLISD